MGRAPQVPEGADRGSEPPIHARSGPQEGLQTAWCPYCVQAMAPPCDGVVGEFGTELGVP